MDARIEAEAEVFRADDADALAQRLQEADLVLLPFRFEGDQPLGPFDEPFDAVFSRLPAAAMVRAAEDIDLDAAPEEGELAEQVAVFDELDAAQSRADKMTRAAQKAAAEAQKMQQEYEAVLAKPGDSRGLEEIREALRQTRARAEEAERRVAKARAKLEDALQHAEALGLAVTREEEPEEPPDIDSQT
jgi:hypothetical protein